MKLNSIYASLFIFLTILAPHAVQAQQQLKPLPPVKVEQIQTCLSPVQLVIPKAEPLIDLLPGIKRMAKKMEQEFIKACMNGRNLKKDYVAVCKCLGPEIIKDEKERGIEKFNKTLSSAILKNGITYALTLPQTPMNKKKADKTKVQEKTIGSVNSFYAFKSKDFTKLKKELIEDTDKFNDCGFSIGEFRRFTRIPSGDFVAAMNASPRDSAKIDNEWEKYLKINPELTSISSGLKDAKEKSAFKQEFVEKFQSMFTQNAPVDMWKQVDDQFGQDGEIRGVIDRYQDGSLAIQKEGIKRANKMYTGDDKGFSANIKTLLNNESVWNAYFVEDGTGGSSCKVEHVGDETYLSNSCSNNISGFCGVYESSGKREKEFTSLSSSESWDFAPMLQVEQSYDESMKLFKEQGTLLCKTSFKTNEIVDKQGRKVEEEMNFTQFKNRLCDKKDLDLKAKEVQNVDKLCDPSTSDNFTLLGIFHKFIPQVSRQSALNSDNTKTTDELVTFLRQRALAGPLSQQGSDESNIIAALAGQSGKEGLAIFQKLTARDVEKFNMVQQTYAQVSKDGPSVSAQAAPSVVTNSSGIAKEATSILQPVQDTTFNSGFAPAGEMKTNVPANLAKNEVLNTESKNMAQISEKITQLVKEKDETKSAPDKEVVNTKIDDEIADLRKQLAASEARYKKTLAELRDSPAKESPVKNNQITANAVQNNSGTFASNSNNFNNVANGQASNGGNAVNNNNNGPGMARLSGGAAVNRAALNSEGTNNALLLANSVNIKGRSPASYNESSSLFKIVRAEDKNEIGLVSDKAVFTKFVAKDKSVFEKYASEMKEKNIKVLLVQNESNNQVLRYTLVGNKLEEEGQGTVKEQKYFSKNLKNIIQSETSTIP